MEGKYLAMTGFMSQIVLHHAADNVMQPVIRFVRLPEEVTFAEGNFLVWGAVEIFA